MTLPCCVLRRWQAQGVVHAVFPSRRGLLPAVRAFIDFLAERTPAVI
jgi:DNA-binding transcriptional LysR family regulator